LNFKIKGFSGLLVSCLVMHRTNCLDVCKMYRDLLGQYGFRDQLRVDHGREFFLMLYLQHKFQVLRFDVNNQHQNKIVLLKETGMNLTNDLFIQLKNFLLNLKIITFLI
jgi:hypothetical protein